MLAGTRYKGDDFEKARKLLSQIRQRPTLAIQENFERQFINMRFMTGCFIGFTGERSLYHKYSCKVLPNAGSCF